jgi:protein TonB
VRSAFFFIIVSRDPFLAGDLRRIAPLAALVVALHAALLAVPVRSARIPDAPPPVSVMQVRMLGTQDGDTGAIQAATPPRTDSEPAARPQVQWQAPTAGIASASASPPQPAFGLVTPAGESDAEYYPRAALSLAPAPLDAIVIDYPPIADDSGHHVSELSLFIDEAGRVTRVRVDGQALPPALEQAARAAFTGARFRPGEVEGRAVKSRIRIEVVFDARPLGSQR